MGAAAAEAEKLAKPVANLAINDITAYTNAHTDFDLAASSLTPARVIDLVKLLASDQISSKQAKEVLLAIIEEDKDPATVVEERGMKQVSDTGAIEAIIDAVLAENPDAVQKYKDGNAKITGFLVGQCMKQMKGQGNPKIINEILFKKLG